MASYLTAVTTVRVDLSLYFKLVPSVSRNILLPRYILYLRELKSNLLLSHLWPSWFQIFGMKMLLMIEVLYVFIYGQDTEFVGVIPHALFLHNSGFSVMSRVDLIIDLTRIIFSKKYAH